MKKGQILLSKDPAGTKKIAQRLAKEIVAMADKRRSGKALVLSLEGNLGAGKTTFTQGLAKALGIRHKVASPTFVLMKHYEVPAKKTVANPLHSLYHIDCYRLEDPKDLLGIGFGEILQDPGNLILIEWGDLVRKVLPRSHVTVTFRHAGKDLRRIRVSGIA